MLQRIKALRLREAVHLSRDHVTVAGEQASDLGK